MGPNGLALVVCLLFNGISTCSVIWCQIQNFRRTVVVLFNPLYIYFFSIHSKSIVEGDSKALFSIATTLIYRRGRYSFPGLLHFTLDTYLIMLSVKQGGIKYHFFLDLWYNSTWDWTPVSRTIGEHSTQCTALVGRIRGGVIPFPMVLSESERNSATGVRTCVLWFCSPLL